MVLIRGYLRFIRENVPVQYLGDQQTRFGFEYLETSLRATNRKIMVINETECNDDLVQDMIDVLTSFCARLYGRRSAKRRAKKALKACQT